MPGGPSSGVVAAARVALALGGTATWGYWFSAGPGLSPAAAIAAWAAGLGLWALALFSRWPVPRPDGLTVTALAVVALAQVPRAVGIHAAPFGITIDEVIHPFLGLQALREQPWEIVGGVSRYFRTPYLTQVLQGWPCVALPPLLGARAASLGLGVVSLLATYALAGRLVGRAIAVLATALLACAFWHIAYARMGYPFMQPMAFVPLTLHLLILGVERRNWFLQFAGGVLLGASLLVYTPARIVIPLFVAWALHRAAVRRAPLEAAVPLAVAGLGAAIFLGPYVRTEGLGGVLLRYRETTMGAQGPIHLLQQMGWFSAEAWRLLGAQLNAAAGIYYGSDAAMALHDWARRPLVDWVTLGLAAIGFVGAAARPRDSGRLLLVLWIVAPFLLGQVLTDVPQSAYRAGVLLPALVICAGLGSRTVGRWIGVWADGREGRALAGAMVLVLVAVLPANLAFLRAYLSRRADDPVAGMARLIEAGDREAAYYLVTATESYAGHELFRFLADGRTVRDLPNPMDSLGATVDDTRTAVFVFPPGMAAAMGVIQRCYPGARLLHEPVPGPAPVLALWVSADAVRAGRGCAAPDRGPGLRAVYFSGDSWDGPVRRERLEDWPLPRRQDPGDDFGSVEWTGFLRLPVPGEYRFQWLLGGGDRDPTRGEVVIGSAVRLGAQGDASGEFAAGLYPLRLRCRPGARQGYCWLRWQPPGGWLEAVPPQFFVPP